MAGYSVSKEKNSKSLIRTCKLLDSITDKYTVFFGTMLGLHREGDVIDGDDDCDNADIGITGRKSKSES